MTCTSVYTALVTLTLVPVEEKSVRGCTRMCEMDAYRESPGKTSIYI